MPKLQQSRPSGEPREGGGSQIAGAPIFSSLASSRRAFGRGAGEAQRGMADERPLSARAPASGGDRDPAATPAERRPSKARRMSAGAITDLGDGVRAKGRRLSANLGESLQEFARMTQVQQSGYKDPMVASIAEQVRRYDKSMVHKGRASLSQRIAIDPRTSAWIGWWDGVISIALIFTAIVTPVEVGFMSIPQDRWQDPLFLTNRGVDVIFILDLLLQFVLMYPATGSVAGVTTHGSSNMVDDLRLIAKNYLFSWWFALDFFSIGVSGFDMCVFAARAPMLVPISPPSCTQRVSPPPRQRGAWGFPPIPAGCGPPVATAYDPTMRSAMHPQLLSRGQRHVSADCIAGGAGAAPLQADPPCAWFAHLQTLVRARSSALSAARPLPLPLLSAYPAPPRT